MTLFADLLTTVFQRRGRILPLRKRDPRPIGALTAKLAETRSETTALATAERILQRYAAMDGAERRAFFAHLARDMGLDAEALRVRIAAYEADPSRENYTRLMAATEPPRQEVIRRLNQVPGATEFLVAMRADLIAALDGDPALAALDHDFRDLLRSWFNRGFIVLRPISWESPAHILEKIIAYEAVHRIGSWDDLRRRLAPPDRRCFAFFHPAMPDEPLIFVEVALTKGVPGSIRTLLEEDDAIAPEEADTAVFYSISNCQPGLAGISFGNSLIKQVARDLAAALPRLATFVTLSPIPGLCRWLTSEGIAHDPDDAEAMRAHAARYLTGARRGDGQPVDPVARFHLSNGAMIHAVHGGADISDNGRTQSGGAMVNYLYDLDRVEERHEAFMNEHKIAAAPSVSALAARAGDGVA